MPKVLVVDDSVSVRTVVEHALQGRQIDVLCAASGTEAMARMRREEPDLVLCDVSMSDMDGYQLCEFVRNHPRLRGTPVLLMSGVVDGAVLARAGEVCSSDVIRKPFGLDDLLNKIEALLGVSEPALVGPAAAPGASGAPSVGVTLEPREDVKAVLGRIAALSGVSLAALVDGEGFLIEAAGDLVLESELAGALAVSLADAAAGVGRDLKQGPLASVIAEYEGGLMLVSQVGPGATLAAVLCEPALLGTVRDHVKTALSDLLELL